MTRNRILVSGITILVLAIATAAFFIYNSYRNESSLTGISPEESEIQTKQTVVTQGNSLFTFQEIPYASPDLVNPGRGAEEWIGSNTIDIPAEGTHTQRTDAYYRFTWTSFENIAKGGYNWESFDKVINTAIEKKQKFSFGIMTVYPGGRDQPGVVNYDNGFAAYPQWVHGIMQSEGVKDWKYEGCWIPNWNSNTYLQAWEDFNIALNEHIRSGSYRGVLYKDIINYIDIRGYGAFGEWHSYPYKDEVPASTIPGVPVLMRIIDATKNAYQDFQLVAMSDGFNPEGWSNMPQRVTYELLTGRNQHNEFGWRRDNWGDAHNWYPEYLEKNPNRFNGKSFREIIMNKWKYAPVVGEPLQCCTKDGGDCPYWELETQVRRYHTAMFGNGNLENPELPCVKENIRAAAKAAGYRIILSGGDAPESIERDKVFSIKTIWQNTGVAPVYFDEWAVVFELQDANGKAKWTGTSALHLKLFLPDKNKTEAPDQFKLPADLSPGVYKLVVRVKDINNYRNDMFLAINGRNTDGSYTLLKEVTVH